MEKNNNNCFLVGVLTNGTRSVFLGPSANPASRTFVTKKNKTDATQRTNQTTVSPATGAPRRASGTRGSQLRDLMDLLLRLSVKNIFLKWNQI